MVFNLVRVDAEESNKIHLPIGTHLIGRVSCLDCNDKRISRNHGKLIVAEGSLVIEALHQNPCFFTTKGSKQVEILRKFSKITLQNGDRFGLLRDTYWYEVLHCSPETDSQATDVSNTQEEVSSEPKAANLGTGETNDDCDRGDNENDLAKEDKDGQNEETIQDKDGQNDETIQNRDPSKATSNTDGDIDENSELLNFDLNETVEDVGRAESPSLLDKNQQEEIEVNEPPTNPEASPNTTVEEPVTDEPQNTESIADEQQSQPSDPEQQPSSPPPKRSHSPEGSDAEGAKKVKTEPVDVKDEPVVKEEPEDAKAGPSNDHAGASDNAADPGKAPPSPAKPPNRERCFYGANCYRRNPVHLAQYSHPADADWGAGERSACPRGGACRKRDPRHWRLHTHPGDARPPPPVQAQRPRAKARKQKVRSEESDSDSQSPSSLIVQGKRPRRLIPKDSPGSESDPEDPFNSDGSEDWEPPSDYTQSQDF